MKKYVVIAAVALTVGSAIGVGIGYAIGHRLDDNIDSPRRYGYRFHSSKPIPQSEALERLEQRLAVISPPPALDLAELAAAYLERGKLTGEVAWLDKAEKTAEKSLQILATPNPARMVLARLASERHDFRRAISLAELAMKERASSAPLTVVITARLALGDLDEASALADELVDAFPLSGSYFLRALVNAAQGRDREAAADFQRAADREEAGNLAEAARLRALWGRFYLRLGRLSDGQKLVEESLRILPGDPLALAVAGEIALRRGRPNEAATCFIDAFATARQPRYLVLFAKAKGAAGDTQAANDAYTQAERLLRRDLEGGRYGHRLDLVELLLDRGKAGDSAEALRLAEAELKVRHSADALFALARARSAAGRRDDAIRTLREVLRTGARWPEYYAWAGKLERDRNRISQAELFEKLAKGERASGDDGVIDGLL